MNRGIFFRGRTLYGHWVYGSLIIDAFRNHQIITHKLELSGKSQSIDHYEVDPYTIGQFTRLTDMNGLNIFEGDILLKRGNPETTTKKYLNQKFVVRWDETYARWDFMPENKMPDNYLFVPHVVVTCQVIGNIHDSPHLITS